MTDKNPDYSNLKPRDPDTGEEIGDYFEKKSEQQQQRTNPPSAVAKDYKHPLPFSGKDIEDYTDIKDDLPWHNL